MLSALTVLPCFQQWFQSPVLTMWQYFTQRHTSKNQSCLLNKSRVYIKLGPVWKTLMLKETFCGRTMTALAAGYSHFTPPTHPPTTTPTSSMSNWEHRDFGATVILPLCPPALSTGVISASTQPGFYLFFFLFFSFLLLHRENKCLTYCTNIIQLATQECAHIWPATVCVCLQSPFILQ